jgi:hypothetical protein
MRSPFSTRIRHLYRDRPTDLFKKSAILFTAEIMRSDELAMIAFKSLPIALLKVHEVYPETHETHVIEVDAPGFDWQVMFDDIRARQGLIVSRFEILCYRGKGLVKALTPQKSFRNYSEVKNQAARIIPSMFVLHTSAEINLCMIAQVTENAANKYFANLKKEPSSTKYKLVSESELRVFSQAVDTWQERYTDSMCIEMYRRTKRFPIVSLPPIDDRD